MDNVPYETSYDYEPETGSGNFLRMKKKGDKVKFRIASKPVQFRRMYQDKEKQMFAWIVIDREDGKPKVFQAGVSVYLQIRNFALEEDWGDPMKYDFTIERTEASTANYYAVTPSPKHSDITDEEKQAITDAKIDLIAICAKTGTNLKATNTFGANENVNPDDIPL
jgi:hypothetical protein